MPVVQFTKEFMATGLVCPPDRKRIEYSVKGGPGGLFVECRPNSVPVWYVRMKNAKGTNTYKRLGTLAELTLKQAVNQAALVKAENALAVKQEAAASESDKSAITLDTFWTEHYLPYAKIHKRSWVRDEQLYRIRIKPRFGDTKLSDITRYAVLQFQNDLTKEKLSPQSQDHHIRLSKRLMSLASSWQFIDGNVLKGLSLRNVDNRVENYLNDEQLAHLVEILRNDSNRTVSMAILMMTCTGMRKSEVLTATWNSVDLDAGVIRIDANRAKGKRTRVLPMNESCRWVVENLASKGVSEFLFPSPVSGLPFTTITRVWYRIRKKAGIPNNVRLHDIRHTWLSLLARRGCSQVQLQQLAGHQDFRTTSRYLHWSQRDLYAASSLGSVIVSSVPTPTPPASPVVQEGATEAVDTATILPFPRAA